jgi:adenosylhomocysteine nucleosidase
VIAITFALPRESSRFLPRLRHQTNKSRNGVTTIRGRIKDNDIVILHTGVGETICRYRIENLLEEAGFRFLISSGFAGAVREDFCVGDLILAENFSDPQLLSIAQRTLRNRAVYTAKLFTSKTVINSLDERNAIAQRHGAAAIDMETEIIANACAARGIPLLSLRVISDTASKPLPAPPDVLFDIGRQKINFIGLIAYLMKRPSALRRLSRFARQIRVVRDNLADSLITLLGSDGW